MCGIFGTVNLLADPESVRQIAHRGPDANGSIDLFIGSHSVHLAHTRLAIVDLSEAGAQPMAFDSAGAYLVFNGEIYNHLALRSGLQFKDFKGHSDTESLLHHLIENGPHASTELNGIFSFAYVDQRHKKLFLVRDPYGVKPLYYAEKNNGLAFCSEISPLIDLFKPSISPLNLSELLRLRYLPAPNTLFDGIHKLKPGHILEIDLSVETISVRSSSYIQPNRGFIQSNFKEAVAEYGQMFEAAVKRQLMSDVDVGVFLSGGVDSALVAKYASENADYKMKAFTVGFEDYSNRDELSLASSTADLLGMDHVKVMMSEEGFFNSIESLCAIVEEPLATTSIIPFHFLCQGAAESLKVVLTGQGADEPLGGYGRYQGALLFDYIPAWIANLLPINAFEMLAGHSLARGIHALRAKGTIERLVSAYEVFSSDEIFRLTGIADHKSQADIQYFYNLLECNNRKSTAQVMMDLDSRLNLSDDLLLYTDKVSMRHSLECRVPILDHQLMRYIEALPLNYKMRFGKGKVIHKAFAKSVLPSSIVNRKKLGFQSPTDQWFKNSDFLKQRLLDTNSKLAGVVDIEEVAKVMTQHDRGRNKERHLFLLLSLYHWLEKFS